MSTYLVTTATGAQGRATIDALLARGAKVNAVVRDPTKAAARELEGRGITLFKGDHDDFDAFREAARGCAAIFLNLLPRPINSEQGKQAAGILAACKEAGVEHVVASTAIWAGNREKWDIPAAHEQASSLIEYYEDEVLVEDAVRRSGLTSYTIIRPSMFQSNYLIPVIDIDYPEFRETGELIHSCEPGTSFPHINVGDIGQFAAMALTDPSRFAGHEIELASEDLTIEELAEAIGEAVGKQILTRRVAAGERQRKAESTRWNIWANIMDLKVDTHALAQKYGYRFTTFGEFLAKEKGGPRMPFFQ
ncbi:NmrA family protein [Xylaria palmicola]|nr:NmrA family protein [Xylaria palmicola]